MEGNLWLYRLYFRVVILLWLPVSLSAVDLPNLTFRTITISDGLSNNIIKGQRIFLVGKLSFKRIA